MFETDAEIAEISFQWVVGDTRALEKNLVEIVRPKYHYAIVIFSRLVACLLTFAVAFALLPTVDLKAIFYIAVAGSLSVWASMGVELLAWNALDRILARDPRRVGWNYVLLDASGIIWNTETSEEYTSWLGVLEVVEQDGSLWLKTGQAHGCYLPARIFKTADELAECRKLIQSFRANPLPPRHLISATEDLVRH